MARTGTAHREQPPLPRRGGGFHPALRNALNRRNRGVGGVRETRTETGAAFVSRPRSEQDGETRPPPLPAFSFTRFFLHRTHTYAYNTSRDAYPRATPPGMNTYGGQCIDVRTRSTLAAPRFRRFSLLFIACRSIIISYLISFSRIVRAFSRSRTFSQIKNFTMRYICFVKILIQRICRALFQRIIDF